MENECEADHLRWIQCHYMIKITTPKVRFNSIVGIIQLKQQCQHLWFMFGVKSQEGWNIDSICCVTKHVFYRLEMQLQLQWQHSDSRRNCRTKTGFMTLDQILVSFIDGPTFLVLMWENGKVDAENSYFVV